MLLCADGNGEIAQMVLLYAGSEMQGYALEGVDYLYRASEVCAKTLQVARPLD